MYSSPLSSYATFLSSKKGPLCLFTEKAFPPQLWPLATTDRSWIPVGIFIRKHLCSHEFWVEGPPTGFCSTLFLTCTNTYHII